jgi:hypothetical protein
MRDDFSKYKRQRAGGKKRRFGGILTLDDLPKTNWKYRQLVAQLQAQYQVDKEKGKDEPSQKSEDFSI